MIPQHRPTTTFQPINIGGIFQQAFNQSRAVALMDQENQRKEEERQWEKMNIQPLRLESQKLQLESSRLQIASQEQGLADARRKAEADNSEIELNKQYGGMVDRILGETADTWNGVRPAPTGATFGGLPISTSYKGAKVSHFAGDSTMDDPIDNSRGAWGADTSKIAGVAVPEKILKELYGNPNNRDENGHFKGGMVRVKARMADGTIKEVDAPIVDKGTAEWVWKRDGAKLDMTTTLAKQLGANVSRNNISGIQDVDFDFLDADGKPLSGGSEAPPPKHLAPVEGPPDFGAKLKQYEQIASVLASGTIPDKNSIRRLTAAKLAIEMDPVFTSGLKVHQAEQQRVQLASQVGTAMAAANPQAAADFQSTYSQWSGIKMAPDAQGGYHPVKADGSKLSAVELGAFATSWQGFAKDWKPGNAFRMNSEQSRALTAFKSAEAVYKLNPKDVEANQKYEGAKAALVALGTAAPEFGQVIAAQLPMPAPAKPKTDTDPPPPPTDEPLSLDSIPDEADPEVAAKAVAVNEEWSAAKDQVAERLGSAFKETKADGEASAPTRILPELNPETVKATLNKKGPLTQREQALVSTLRRAKDILTDKPIKTGGKTNMTGFGDGMKAMPVDSTIPAADFYAKDLEPFTIGGKKVPAADVLRAWAEEVFERAGIPLKEAKKAKEEPVLSTEVKAEIDNSI
jgi:hypothetical protein